jgi:hypothetical protein
MFIASAPGVKFIKILCLAFTTKDPKSTKKTVKLQVFFTLLGSMLEKAAHRLLMKLTPDYKSAKRL